MILLARPYLTDNCNCQQSAITCISYYLIPKGLLLYIANNTDAANDIPSIMGDKIPFKDKPQDHDGCLDSLYVLNPGQLYQQCRWWFNSGPF